MGLSSLMRGATLSGDVQENHEDVLAIMNRLKEIVSLFVGVYGSLVAEIHINPPDIVCTKACNLEKVKFCVVYIDSVETAECLSDAKEMFKALVDDEFDDVKNGVDIIFDKSVTWKFPTLLVYSVFDKSMLNAILSAYYPIMRELINAGYEVSVPVDFLYQRVKCIYVHSVDKNNFVNTESVLSNKGFDAKEYTKADRYKNKLYFVMLLSTGGMGYNLPYIYIDASVCDEYSAMFNIEAEESQNEEPYTNV